MKNWSTNFRSMAFFGAMLSFAAISQQSTFAQSTASFKASSAAVRSLKVGGQHTYYGNIVRNRSANSFAARRYSRIGIGSVGLGFSNRNPYFSGYGIVPGTFNRFGYYSYQNQIPLFSIYPPTYYRSSDFGTAPKSVSGKVEKVERSGPKVIENPFYISKPAKKRNKKKRAVKKKNGKKQKVKKAEKKADKELLPEISSSAPKGKSSVRGKVIKRSSQVLISNPFYRSANKGKERRNNLL